MAVGDGVERPEHALSGVSVQTFEIPRSRPRESPLEWCSKLGGSGPARSIPYTTWVSCTRLPPMENTTPLRAIQWNKSLATNVVAAVLVALGFLLPDPVRRPVLYVGLFALSGAMTNWLAIHMLFERVPGLHGSGVIPAHFEDIKREIRRLVMEQFFGQAQLERFASRRLSRETAFDFGPIIEETDISPVFDALASLIESSSVGGLLRAFGGTGVLEPMREPFSEKMKQALKDLAATRSFQAAVQSRLSSPSAREALQTKVETLVQERLDELTPQQVKEIMQKMIRDHLGWLVVWGGVFGGIMGLLTSLLPV